MEETNGHSVADAHKKRKSQTSPLLDGAGSPNMAGEPKRPKISEFAESNKNVEVTQIEFNDVLSAIFFVIQGFDKYAALNSSVDAVVDGEKVQISGNTVKSKLKDSGYSSVLAFKV